MNDDSTATFVSKFKVTVDNGETAEFASHNPGWLKQNLAVYNDLLAVYRLTYREMAMDYKDVQDEAAKYWRQLKARCQPGLYTKTSFRISLKCMHTTKCFEYVQVQQIFNVNWQFTCMIHIHTVELVWFAIVIFYFLKFFSDVIDWVYSEWSTFWITVGLHTLLNRCCFFNYDTSYLIPYAHSTCQTALIIYEI